jgi:3-deoxy-D-manno-octulosonic acid kinase
MLFDAALTPVADEHWFEPEHWSVAGTIERIAGGRGSVVFLRDTVRRWVLRHYRRGGAVARLLDDRYLWTGEERTRAFREWRLLKRLEAWQLPVPRAVAARYRREALIYRADLITEELPATTTLAQSLQSASLDEPRWRAVGACLRRFHEHGVQHADLNAHNILLGGDGTVHVIDFDRGRVRGRGAWEDAVLARLHRSLVKVTRGLPPERFADHDWRALLAGYAGG